MLLLKQPESFRPHWRIYSHFEKYANEADTSPELLPAVSVLCFSFYRAMHYSAKRGLAIACRLSVRPSVCL